MGSESVILPDRDGVYLGNHEENIAYSQFYLAKVSLSSLHYDQTNHRKMPVLTEMINLSNAEGKSVYRPDSTMTLIELVEQDEGLNGHRVMMQLLQIYS